MAFVSEDLTKDSASVLREIPIDFVRSRPLLTLTSLRVGKEWATCVAGGSSYPVSYGRRWDACQRSHPHIMVRFHLSTRSKAQAVPHMRLRISALSCLDPSCSESLRVAAMSVVNFRKSRSIDSFKISYVESPPWYEPAPREATY